jgi:thiaminase
MVPCSRLYAFLGCGLAKAHPASGRQGHPYNDWIGMYSGSDFLVGFDAGGIAGWIVGHAWGWAVCGAA